LNRIRIKRDKGTERKQAIPFHSSLSCSFSLLPLYLFLFILYSFHSSKFSCSFQSLPLQLSLFIPPPLPFEYSFSHFLLESILFTLPSLAVPFHSSLSCNFSLFPQLFLITPPQLFLLLLPQLFLSTPLSLDVPCHSCLFTPPTLAVLFHTFLFSCIPFQSPPIRKFLFTFSSSADTFHFSLFSSSFSLLPQLFLFTHPSAVSFHPSIFSCSFSPLSLSCSLALFLL
jgi:hypothetical protein